MATQSGMKSHLAQLEDRKRQLEDAIRTASQRFKWSLWGLVLGVILLPVYWSGVPVLLIAGAAALFYGIKRSSSQDKLGAVESEIHNLEISMA